MSDNRFHKERRSGRAPAMMQGLESRSLLAASATLVTEIFSGAISGVSWSSARQRAVFGTDLVFAAADGSAYISDGTDAGTQKLTMDGFTEASEFVAGGKYVYFTGRGYDFEEGNEPTEVWRSTGTTQSTTGLTTFAGAAIPTDLRYVNGKLVFFSIGTNTPALWTLSNNQFDPQAYLASIEHGSFMAQANGTQFFTGRSPDGTQVGLWATNGVQSGFVRDFSFGSSNGINANYFASNSIEYKTRLYFNASTPSAFAEPWRSDGTESGTLMVANINAADSSSPTQYAVSGGTLYFVATGGASKGNYQIYSTTGTGATKITALASGSIANLTDVGGTLFFTYQPNNSSVSRLYKLVGNKPTLVGGTSPADLTTVGNTLFFSAADSKNVRRLYQFDGAAIELVDGQAGTNPSGMINVNGSLFFQASDPATGTELRVIRNVPVVKPDIGLRIKPDKTTINEGDSITFKATTAAGVKIAKYYWNTADSDETGYVVDDAIRSETYYSNRTDNAPFTVRLKVKTEAGQTYTTSTKIIVKNVAPKIVSAAMASNWTTYLAMDYSVKVADPGKLDDVQVSITWGDGRNTTEHVGSDGFVRGRHRFLALSSGPGNIRIRAFDGEGAAHVVKKTVRITPLAEAVHGKVVNLMIGGTEDGDTLQIKKSAVQPGTGKVALDFILNGTPLGSRTLDANAIIDASMGPGDDSILVDSVVTKSGVEFNASGDEGIDTLNGTTIK